MNGLARWVPRLMIATAVLHFAWAFVQPNDWSGIARDGFFGSVVDQRAEEYYPREATVWFMAAGVVLLAYGSLTHHTLRATGRLPAQVGWFLMAIGMPLCVIYFPTTGSWALPVIGVVALIASRRSKQHAVRPPGQETEGRPGLDRDPGLESARPEGMPPPHPGPTTAADPATDREKGCHRALPS